MNSSANINKFAHWSTGFIIALLAFVIAPPSFGQVEKGIITGQVKDGSGAVIGHAHVTLKSTATSIVTTTTSDGQGIFISPPLAPGNYDVQVEATGFEGILRHVRLEVSQRISAEFVLPVAEAAAETVEVDATTVQFDTNTSTLSNLRTQEAVRNLPLNGRNFAELLGLGAGVVPGESQLTGNVAFVMERGPSSYSINGQRMTDNRFLLDGIGDNENHNGRGVIIFPPIDAIEEFREETTDADTRYGRAAGGVINVVFKSGTDHYHGEVFNFFRSSVLDAKNYFDSTKPGFRMNSFGATLGGPLWNTKSPHTFFFADYAGQRTSQGLTFISTVPVWGPEGVGDFSLYSTVVNNPVTKTAFTGNIVPSSYLTSTQSLVGQNILALFSANKVTANIAGTSIANNFRYTPQRIDAANAYDVKVDHQFSQSDSAFARYSHSYDNIVQPGLLPTPLVGANTCGLVHQPAHQAVLSETHVFSPTLLNTASFGWSRIFIQALALNQGKGLSAQLGIQGVIQLGDVANTDALPVLSTTGITPIGDAANSPAQIGTNNYQINDNISLLRGKHSFDFGVEIVRLQYNVLQTSAEHGTMSFTGNFTGLGLADLLLGAPYSGTYQYQRGTRGFRQLDVSAYAQVNYQVNSRMTLNFGVRYDNFLGWPGPK